jgi:hypothetical protein
MQNQEITTILIQHILQTIQDPKHEILHISPPLWVGCITDEKWLNRPMFSIDESVPTTIINIEKYVKTLTFSHQPFFHIDYRSTTDLENFHSIILQEDKITISKSRWLDNVRCDKLCAITISISDPQLIEKLAQQV